MRQTIIICCLALLIAGCGMPKITVLEDPLSSQEHLELGLAYEKQGKYELAAQEYLSAAKEFPQAHFFAGNAFLFAGRDGDAVGSYRQAIKAQPKNPLAYNNLAWLLCARGEDLAEAEFLAQRAVALTPPDRNRIYQDTLDKVRQTIKSGKPACERPGKSSPNSRD